MRHVGVVAEVHFGVIISKEANEISKDHALDYVNGYVVALNSRLRDDEFKKADDSKSSFATITDFKDSVVISNVITKELLPHPNAATIWASLNGKECQRANLTDARMSVQELIEKASQLKTLRAGDLVLSGTPAGSFYIKNGDTVEIGIEDVIRTEISVQKATEVTTTITMQEHEFRQKDKEFP
uniref:oxaloacetate tautomerase n=1 Tax=Panagrolaimus superbus TaxID=310955 RepID=A0A914Y565_9BILA